jgi:hypothetical protein
MEVRDIMTKDNISEVLARNGLHPENHMQCARHAIEDSGSLEINRVLETVARLLGVVSDQINLEDNWQTSDPRIALADARAILAEVLS